MVNHSDLIELIPLVFRRGTVTVVAAALHFPAGKYDLELFINLKVFNGVFIFLF